MRTSRSASITTMDEAIASSLATRRLTMVLLGAFAVLALVLASVGLYGVMALTVTQRTRELGIRMALGAERTNIFKLVLGQGMSLMAIGIAIGLIGAVAAGRALMSLLYNVGAIDAGAVLIAVFSLLVSRADRLLRASSPCHACRSDRRAANRMIKDCKLTAMMNEFVSLFASSANRRGSLSLPS